MPANAPVYDEFVELFETTANEGNWTKVVIREKTVNLTFIPEGATDNTWVDHWMDGSYSTLIRSDNEVYFELQMRLHVPYFSSNFLYMLWHQLYDEKLTLEKDNFTKYYESYTCSVRHSEKALTSSINGNIE